MNRQKQIDDLEERNLELAKEILLNESAIFYVEKEIQKLEKEIVGHEHFAQRLEEIRKVILRMEKENEVYKSEIIQNDLKIKALKGE